MSVSILPHIAERRPAYQPFQCSICQSRFTRHENLKRHAAVHSLSSGERSLSCEFCHTTFSRPDLRLRHLKRKHPQYLQDQAGRRRQSAASIDPQVRPRPSPSASTIEIQVNSHALNLDEEVTGDAVRGSWPSILPGEGSRSESTSRNESHFSLSPAAHADDQNNPDDRTQDNMDDQTITLPNLLPTTQNLPLVDHNTLSVSPSLGLKDALNKNDLSKPMPQTPFIMGPEFNFDQWSPDRLLSQDTSQSYGTWAPSRAQTLVGCQLFFTHISDFLPFIHYSTFQADQVSRSLLLSMLCLAYQYGDDPDCDNNVGSGINLSVNCFHQARILIAAEEESREGPTCNLGMVQTYLLLQIFAMLYSENDDDSAYGLKTHSKMIAVSRAGGLMQHLPSEANMTEDLDSLWQYFAQAESRKRIMFAIHQIDTLWYQFLSIPRSLSHLEIKHDLPCPDSLWAASSSGEWAHRQLVNRSSSPTIQYQDAVRRVLSSGRDSISLPAFDIYGAINITQFLVSSAREISGWSTMTGMLSMERFEPLRLSLLALGPLVHAESSSHTALCEATWETAMIEIQMWSPSHTGGVVGNSMEVAIHQLLHLAPSLEFVLESHLAKSVQPHIDWFLLYLDATVIPYSEAPWLTLYACKAFTIALQLIKGNIAGAMQVVGISDGDVEGALTWATKVFRRRERWKLGKIVLSCLERLET